MAAPAPLEATAEEPVLPAPRPLIGRLRAHPQLMRYLNRRHVLLERQCGLQSHLLPPCPPRSGKAITIGISHTPGVDLAAILITQARRL